ncbi:hypothetical protein E2562_019568 [Oryza meyeriana var. granulata]|uniref:Uncharacterized protein n=1 Tax=Oryza meyeriana var. granulata TaxID=110450 RepID=A0A6G1BYE4_9ORYZ|nr:hypothetical protein E2562_019568 [Oryza meyeriana var. granulata]
MAMAITAIWTLASGHSSNCTDVRPCQTALTTVEKPLMLHVAELVPKHLGRKDQEAGACYQFFSCRLCKILVK